MSRLNPRAVVFEPRDELVDIDNIEYIVWDSENRLRNHILSFNKKRRQDFIKDMVELYTEFLDYFMGGVYSDYEQSAEEIKLSIEEDYEGIERMALLLYLDKLKDEAHIDFPRETQHYIYIGPGPFLDEKKKAKRELIELLKTKKQKAKRAEVRKQEKTNAEKRAKIAKETIQKQKNRKKNIFCINNKDYYSQEEIEDIPTDELVKLHFKNKIQCLDKNTIKQIFKSSNIKTGYVNDKSIELYFIGLSFSFYVSKKEGEKLLRNMKNKKDHFEIIKTDKKVKMGYNNYINLYKFNITRAFKKPSLPKRKPRKKLKKTLSELKGGGFLSKDVIVPVKNNINQKYKTVKLTKIQKDSLSKIKKIAKRESEKYKAKTYKLFKAYYKLYSETFLKKIFSKKKKLTETDYNKLFKKFIDEIKNNPILTIHFPKRAFNDIYNSGKLLNTYEIDELKGEEINPFYNDDEDTYVDFDKMTDKEKNERFEHNRLYTEHKLLRYPMKMGLGKQRPVYGCLNGAKNINGCARTYGDFWIRLYTNKNIRDRITLTALDSLYQLDDYKNASDIVGTLEHFYHILYFSNNTSKLFEQMVKVFVTKKEGYHPLPQRDYIEFQIHGTGIDLKNHIAEIFHPKEYKTLAKKFCKKFDCKAIEFKKKARGKHY